MVWVKGRSLFFSFSIFDLIVGKGGDRAGGVLGSIGVFWIIWSFAFCFFFFFLCTVEIICTIDR